MCCNVLTAHAHAHVHTHMALYSSAVVISIGGVHVGDIGPIPSRVLKRSTRRIPRAQWNTTRLAMEHTAAVAHGPGRLNFRSGKHRFAAIVATQAVARQGNRMWQSADSKEGGRCAPEAQGGGRPQILLCNHAQKPWPVAVI